MKQLKTALIVIDMQADYIGKKSKNKYYPHTLIEKINALQNERGAFYENG